jgi:hypothetical protein
MTSILENIIEFLYDFSIIGLVIYLMTMLALIVFHYQGPSSDGVHVEQHMNMDTRRMNMTTPVAERKKEKKKKFVEEEEDRMLTETE